jgi:hypothetical protein
MTTRGRDAPLIFILKRCRDSNLGRTGFHAPGARRSNRSRQETPG